MLFIIRTLLSCFPRFSPRLLGEDIGNEGDKAFLSTVISDWTHFLDPTRALAVIPSSMLRRSVFNCSFTGHRLF